MTSSLVMPSRISIYQLKSNTPCFGHIDGRIADNGRMEKQKLRQVLARNLKDAMAEATGLNTQETLSRRAGLSQGYLSELLRGLSAATTDTIADLANALGRQPWELLVDDEETRKSALAKMILGRAGHPADNIPPPPEEKPPRKRKPGGGKAQPRT